MGKSQKKEAVKESQGKLYVVATPIGNLEDITFRALRIFKEVDLIASEDPNYTLKLLNHYKIRKSLTRYHEPNEKSKAKKLLRLIKKGERVALVSKAGLPGLSDPGYQLIRSCIENDISVEVIPGPSAILTALIISGLPPRKFSFLGFLPRKRNEQKRALEKVKGREETIIFYESPKRLVKTLENIFETLGDRKIVVARELTKKFEEIKRGRVKEILSYFKTRAPRGEFVVLVKGEDEKESKGAKALEELKEEVLEEMRQGASKKDAIKVVSKKHNIFKGKVYEAALEVKARRMTETDNG